ncbi:FCD domain-containing protein [Sporomusa termitida]|uniref:FCD domain-containing protein n=1 Tax=Sporomusa termitida TaxID=2377 RepID=UPI001184A1E0
MFYERPGTPQRVFTAHGELLNALKNRDPEDAEKLMQAHLAEVTEWFGNFSGEKIFNNE